MDVSGLGSYGSVLMQAVNLVSQNQSDMQAVQGAALQGLSSGMDDQDLGPNCTFSTYA